jgi:4-hydroxy-2-oxoheptanedioate aldolase
MTLIQTAVVPSAPFGSPVSRTVGPKSGLVSPGSKRGQSVQGRRCHEPHRPDWPALGLMLAVTLALCPALPLLSQETSPMPSPPLVELLASGQAVFGTFSGDQTAEQGARIVGVREADFILYSMESGPFDVPGMMAYLNAMEEAAAEAAVDPQPLLLRIPPIGGDHDGARDRAGQGIEAGVHGIVFPHVASAEEAAVSVSAIPDLWPSVPEGRLIDVLIVEDREGIANVGEIVSTPGLSVVFAGPGDLSRAYEEDMEAVEAAIQTVLAACLEFDVACGVTAGVDDIAERLEQGFRVIIATEDEALPVGRRAAGRD